MCRTALDHDGVGVAPLLAQRSPAIGWVQPLAPQQFALDSGQSEDVPVTVDVPEGTAPGNYAVNVIAMASVPGCTANCIGAGAGGTLEVHVSGS